MNSSSDLPTQVSPPEFQTSTVIATGNLLVSVLLIIRDPATRALYDRIKHDPELLNRVLRTGQAALSFLK